MQAPLQQHKLNIADLLRRGLAYHRSGQYGNAQEVYSNILAIDSLHPDALNLSGLLALEAGDLERAELLISRAIQADPVQPDFYNNLGNVFLQKECLNKAALNYQIAIKLRPDYAAAHFNLGNVNQKLKKCRDAIANYCRALEIEPEFTPARFNLAKAYRAENHSSLALAALHEVVRLKPEWAEACYELASLYDELSNPDEAIFYYEKFLELNPDCWTSWFNLGNVHRRQKNIELAVRSYRMALKLNPQSAETYLNMGIAHKAAGNLSEAEHCYQRCIEAKPDFAEAYYNLGNLYNETGNWQQAILNYKRSLEINPAMIEVLNNLGDIYRRRGLMDAAVECLSRSLEIDPHHPDTLHNLGTVLIKIDRAQEAIQLFKHALEIEPDLTLSHIGLGSAFLALDRIDEAYACYRQALKMDSNNPVTLFNLGVTCQSRGEYAKSRDYFEQALALAPDLTSARWHCLLLLPVLYDNAEEINSSRQQFENGLENLIRTTELKTPEQCRQAMAGISGKTNFYLAYQGRNDVKLQKKFGNFAVKIMSANYPHWARTRKMPPLKPDGKIRVGFVSSYLYSHTVGIFLKGWVENINREKFETYGYQIHKRSDALTNCFNGIFDQYRLAADNLQQAAGRIVSDNLHILVFTDIGMNPFSIQLASLRLAPVQCKGWGHPVTTGLPTMDFYLSSDLMEPQNAQSHYSEKLIRLPNLALCYQKPVLPKNPATRSYFGISENEFVYLSPQSLFKYLPQYDDIFPRIAQKLNNARFVFISHQTEAVTRKFQNRLRRAFSKYNLDFTAFCKILPKQNFEDYLSLNLAGDVLLDTPGWSGGKTSIEGLSCRLPLVTLPGEFMRGRHAYAMLKMMDVQETIAEDIDIYVDIAVRLGADQEFYRQTRKKIRTLNHRLFNDGSVPKALEEFFANTVREAQTSE